MEITMRVSGYACEPNVIELGAAGSRGVTALHIIFDAGWEGMKKTVNWETGAGVMHTPVDESGMVDVPQEALETAGRRRFSVSGTNGQKRIVTGSCTYKVRQT